VGHQGAEVVASPAALVDPPIDCLDHCAPSITLSNGTFCVLAGCPDVGGGTVICAYNCFFVLPPWPLI
jgi:hypothetical protein